MNNLFVLNKEFVPENERRREGDTAISLGSSCTCFLKWRVQVFLIIHRMRRCGYRQSLLLSCMNCTLKDHSIQVYAHLPLKVGKNDVMKAILDHFVTTSWRLSNNGSARKNIQRTPTPDYMVKTFICIHLSHSFEFLYFRYQWGSNANSKMSIFILYLNKQAVLRGKWAPKRTVWR